MEMGPEAASMADLISALETATLMAKQLPNTIEPSHIRQIYTTLYSTHHHLTAFLANHPISSPQPPLLFPTTLHPPPENSVCSATACMDETMQPIEDENEAEQNPKIGVDGIDERMRECFIRSKRLKRQLSPSLAAEQRRSYEKEAVRGGSVAEFDPQGTRLRALDLIYQFHC